MSAKDFIERMFGELPSLFADEDELRNPWSDPDTRKALLDQMAERGYDTQVLKQIRAAILAENSDLFDVLAHISFAAKPKTLIERAEAGSVVVRSDYDAKLAAVLDYLLGQYVDIGAEGLDRANLPDNLRLKYGSFADGARALGGADSVLQSFVGFQKHIYS